LGWDTRKLPTLQLTANPIGKSSRKEFRKPPPLEWADFVKDADTYFSEIRELVVAMFHGKN